jgi:hypothetical protein
VQADPAAVETADGVGLLPLLCRGQAGDVGLQCGHFPAQGLEKGLAQLVVDQLLRLREVTGLAGGDLGLRNVTQPALPLIVDCRQVGRNGAVVAD